MDSISEQRLSLVQPKLAALTRQLAEQLLQAGHMLRVVQGLRSWNEQAALWATGREQNTDGTWRVVDASKIVTNAPPGFSWHNFGMAVDVCPSTMADVFVPDWNVAHPAWHLIITGGVALGLTSGACFHHPVDNPHLQLTGRFGVSPDGEVRQLFKDGGMQAIWDESGVGLP